MRVWVWLAFAFAICAAACGASDPGLRLGAPAHPAVPPDLAWSEATFDGRGVKLYAQSWRLPANATHLEGETPETHAVVVIHHGLKDHSTRYAAFAEKLARAGYIVWAFDMRGHARSAGARVTADSVDQYLDDLDAFLRFVHQKEPGKPIYLFGHSLGGMISALYVIERHPALAGLVLSGPGIAFDAPALQAAAVRLIAPLAPNMPILDTPHPLFSSDPQVVADMDHDPLIAQGKGPARTARAAVDGARRVWAHPEQIKIPLLVVAGGEDEIVAPSGGRDLVARAGATDKTFVLYPGLAHDLLHEPNGGGEHVMMDVQGWLDAHVAGKPSSLFTTADAKIEHLPGDRPPMALEIDLDGRFEHVQNGGDSGDNGGSGGLRVRAFWGGTASYLAGVDLRAGGISDAYYEADLHALGFALRCHCGALVGLSGGFGVDDLRGETITKLPAELVLEAPAGPFRFLARAGLAWQITGDRAPDDFHGIASEANLFVGFRLGRDLHYWADVVAGTGPYVAFTYRSIAGVDLIGVALGINLFGAN